MTSKKNNILKFPGLNSYTSNQSEFFFSREKEVESILELLQNNKLVTITSKSGAGKSSLINAGIIPRLNSGLPAQAGRDWAICKFRPGISPIENICNSLTNKGAMYLNSKAKSTDFDEYMKDLKHKSASGLIDIYNNSEISEKKNLLVIIDQIEDLFLHKKFFDNESSDDDNLLIDIIYKSVKSQGSAIYFIITVQTPFLSNLNVYGKFSELLSSSQYVLPNINFSNLLKQINLKFTDFSIKFSNDAFEYIENLITENTSLLPNLQLLINEVYTKRNETSNKLIDINEVEKLGNIKNTISYKLDGFFNSLSDEEKKIFELIFRGLIHSDEFEKNNFYQRFGYLKSYTKKKSKDLSLFIKKINDNVGCILDVFSENISDIKSSKNNNFLESDIISLKYHESYNWLKLRKWIKEEYESYELYLDYNNKANLYPEKETLLKKPLLDVANNWINKDHINKHWAAKYSFNFDITKTYITTSKKQNDLEGQKIELENTKNEKWKKRAKSLPFVILLFMGISIIFIYKESHEQKKILAEFQEKESLYDNLEKTKDSLNKEINQFQNSKTLFIDTIANYREIHLKDSLRIKRKDELINYEERIIKEEKIQLDKNTQKIDSLIMQNTIAEKFINISTQEIISNNQIINLNKKIKLLSPFEQGFNEKIKGFAQEALKLYENYIEASEARKRLNNTDLAFKNFSHQSDQNDRNNLTKLALNLISKINGVNNYTEIEKFNLLNKINTKSLNSLAISNQGRFAIGGKNKKLYRSREILDISSKQDIIFDEMKFEHEITAVEFINEDVLCIRLVNGQIWYTNFNTNQKARIYPEKVKKRSRKKIKNYDEQRRKKIKFIPNTKSIFSTTNTKLIQYNLPNKEILELSFDNLANNERLEDITYDGEKYLFITTSIGNIYNYNIKENTHSKILNSDIGLTGNNRAVEIQFYDNKLLIGTNNGWIYIFKINFNKLVYVDRKIAHKTTIIDMHYNKQTNLIYSSGDDGTFIVTSIKEEFEKGNNVQEDIIVELGKENYINSIGYTSSKNKNYIITIDRNGRMIYWDFNIDNLFVQIKKLLHSKGWGNISSESDLNNYKSSPNVIVQSHDDIIVKEEVKEVKNKESSIEKSVDDPKKGKYILVVQVFRSKENTLRYISNSSENLDYHEIDSRYYVYVYRSSDRENVVKYKAAYKNDSWIKNL